MSADSDWRVEEIQVGYCRSMVPLARRARNQHQSHQAATFCLAADYTGGIALYTLLRGLPTFGVHPAEGGWGLNLWLLKSDLKFLKPSTSDLTISARLKPERYGRITRRFFKGDRVIESVAVVMENGGEVVCTGSMTYFIQLMDYRRWLELNTP